MLPDGIVNAWTRKVRITKKRSTAIANDFTHSSRSFTACPPEGAFPDRCSELRVPRRFVELLTLYLMREAAPDGHQWDGQPGVREYRLAHPLIQLPAA